MIIDDVRFELKDGREAILRSPKEEDVESTLEYLVTSAGETDYILRYPEECGKYTAEGEKTLFEQKNASPNEAMIMCIVEGKVVGNCEISFFKGMKTKHRASISIALISNFWNQGIGTKMFEEMIRLAERREGVMQIIRNDYPILEFDDNRDAKINPTTWVDKKFECNKMVITFFPEVVDKLIADGKIVLEKTIGGENIVLVYRFVDTDILITLGAVGCPSCAGNLDLFNAMGAEKVMFCGGGGVLDKKIEVGQLLVVDGAIRDEGFSYHYIKPSKYIYTDKNVTDKIVQYLKENNISYIQGLTWTTDAIFRETAERIDQRKTDGAKIVEMEQSGCIAVAQYRGFDYGALIYGGDDVSQEEWSNRGWRSREGIRYDLVMLCKELVNVI